MDLVMYVSRGSPELRLNEVTQYPVTNDWSGVFSHCIKHPGDDGHLVKLVRALAHGEKVCEVVDKDSQMPIVGDMWLKIGNMGMFIHAFSWYLGIDFSNSFFFLTVQLLTPLPMELTMGRCGYDRRDSMKRGQICLGVLVCDTVLYCWRRVGVM